MERDASRGMRVTARVTVSVLVMVWLWFGISSAWNSPDWLTWVLHLLVPAGVLLLALIISLLRDRLGALVLIGEGLFFSLWVIWSASVSGAPTNSVILLLAILGVPLLIAGGLLLVSAQQHLPRGRAPSSPKE